MNNVVLSKSTDGGQHWSVPQVIDQPPGPHAFNGTVEVTRTARSRSCTTTSATTRRLPVFPTDVWLTHSTDGGATWDRAARHRAVRHEAGAGRPRLLPRRLPGPRLRSATTCCCSSRPRRAIRRTIRRTSTQSGHIPRRPSRRRPGHRRRVSSHRSPEPALIADPGIWTASRTRIRS